LGVLEACLRLSQTKTRIHKEVCNSEDMHGVATCGFLRELGILRRIGVYM
jgi:hypothetical protein